MNARTRRAVRDRAGLRCEYCMLAEHDSPIADLHVEHIIPQKHGGTDALDNLALACIDCNLHKGSNLTGIDPLTGELTSLFHPRLDLWATHFQWDGPVLVGLTNVGRTTIRVMDMNAEDRIELRRLV